MTPDSGPISQEKELTDSEMVPYSRLTMVFFNKGEGNWLCGLIGDSVFPSLPGSPTKEPTR